MSREGSVRLLLIGVSVAVASAVVAGLIVVGSPGEARLEKLDRRRVSDLYEIVDGLNRYWTRNQALPPDLDALTAGTSFELGVDPETGLAYVYRVIEPDRYEVCATFATECTSRDNRCASWRASGRHEISEHGAGKQCFELAPMSLDREARP